MDEIKQIGHNGMKKGPLYFWLLTLAGTLFLLPNFYDNKWKSVEPAYYDEWQTQYDRLVIARLVKTRQDGFLSAGGLLGLGDTPKLNYLSATHRRQYEAFLKSENFETYTVYESNPGFQGILYGSVDKLLNILSEQKLIVFRGITTTISALIFGFIFAFVLTEFGVLAGIFTLLFSATSMWIILPASSIFWNLWALFFPFIVSTGLLANSAKTGIYNASKIHIALFFATLLRILLSGFDIITTGMIMTTVPFIFFGIRDKWSWKIFVHRFVKAGIALIAGALIGVTILSLQIISNDGEIQNAFRYIENRFGSHFAGNSQYYLSGGIEPTKISISKITGVYLNMPAINVRLPGPDIQILYWHLVVGFASFTVIYFLFHRKEKQHPSRDIALIAATWYSILAPLSWFILFRPHSIIHPRVNTMGWQMPFTLLGVALCGFVITDLFRRKTT